MQLTLVSMLFLGLLVAAWHDSRRRRIPNAVVLPGIAFALAAHAMLPPGDGLLGWHAGGLGLWGALKGMGIGFAVLMPLHLVRAAGAGDVKLLAMVGAFLGPTEFWGALLAAVLASGGLVLIAGLRRGVLAQTFRNLRLLAMAGVLRATGGAPLAAPETAARLPFGVAIAAGTIAYAGWRTTWLGLL